MLISPVLRRSRTALVAGIVAIAPSVTGTGTFDGDPGRRIGVPWEGAPGITETVGEIEARDRIAERGSDRFDREPPEKLGPGKQSGPGAPRTATSGSAESEMAVPPTPGVSFHATDLVETPAIPPDTMGSVGPTQVLVHTNGRVKLFDKAGNVGALNVSDDTFWSSVSGGFGISDPHVEYDRLSGRWFMCIINVPPSGANRVLVAVSSGSTITNASSFTFFQFRFDLVGPSPNQDTNKFADYPTLGVDKFALYIGVNVFNSSSGGFSNTTAFVVDKADLISGILTITAFRGLIVGTSAGPFAPQGVHNQDPGATEGYLIGVDFFEFDELVIRRITDPGGTPAISGNITLVVPATEFPMDGVPQPSPGPDLDDLDDRLYAAMIARDPAGQLRLWTAHNIEVDDSGAASTSGNRNGSRWYEIGSLDTTPALIQSGTLFDSAMSQPHSFWIPAIAANGQGHAVLGASRAGADPSTGFAGAAVAERLASDSSGTLSAPVLVQAGAGQYNTTFPGTERWGDYSQTVIDPTDNMTFWTFQEYVNATNSWGVRVVELEAPPPALPSSANPATVPSCNSVDVEIIGTSSGGSGFFDPGPDPGGPGFANHIGGTVDGGVFANGAAYTDPTHVTLDLDTSSAAAGLKGVTITNPDGQSASTPGIVNVSGTDSAPPAAFNLDLPADGATEASASPTLSWLASSDSGCGLDKYQLFIDGFLNRDNISPSATSTTPAAPLSEGLHTWKVRAIDGTGLSTDSTEERTLTVINNAPVLAPIGDKTTTEGQLLSFTISATDADNEPLSFSASNLPPGGTFNPATRAFSWTPGFDQAGLYSGIHFEVADDTDLDAEDIQITVMNGSLGAKQVALKAKPKRVEKGEKTRLTATVTPCPGHEGDTVDFFRGSKKVATKASNADCVAKHRVEMKKTARFQAVSPQQDADHTAGTSNKVKVRVLD